MSTAVSFSTTCHRGLNELMPRQWAPAGRSRSSLSLFRVQRKLPPFVVAASTDEVAETAETAAPAPKAGRSNLRLRTTCIGACAAPQIMPNSDLEAMAHLETSDEWIATRTGISARHLLPKGEQLKGLATKAALQALESSTNVAPEDIDLVIVATSSPDDLFGDAASVAASIGATNAVAFDLTAACSGFLFALVTGSQFLHTGAYKNALVIGADALSRWVDWEDRNVCILFGDGAGAMLLEGTADDDDAEGTGVLGFEMHSNGRDQHHLTLAYQGEGVELADGKHSVTRGAYAPIGMNGREVYKFATREVPNVLNEAISNAGLTVGDIDWLVLHQANIRIMEIVASRLGIPMDKVITNLSEHGNTSAGSIPIALEEAVRTGKVKKGDVIAMAGFGAGLSWGSAIIRWG